MSQYIEISGVKFPITNTPEFPYLYYNNNYSNLEEADNSDYNLAFNNKYYKKKFGIKFNKAEHIIGIVLVEEGNNFGQWTRINENYEPCEFNPEHKSWSNVSEIENENGFFIKIPITWVKNEIIENGTYAGKSCWWIADGEYPGFHIHPAFYNNSGKPSELLISKYLASRTKINYVSKVRSIEVSNKEYLKNNTFNEAKQLCEDEGYRLYSIYDHHFLARMILIQSGNADLYYWNKKTNEIWYKDGTNYSSFLDIKNIFGYYFMWLDKIERTEDGCYGITKNNGSSEIINTGEKCPRETWIHMTNCSMKKSNNYDLGDLFLANKYNLPNKTGSFGDGQKIASSAGSVALAYWNPTDTSGDPGMFSYYFASKTDLSGRNDSYFRMAKNI